MHIAPIKRYSLIAAKDLKHNFLPRFTLSIVLLILTSVLFGINDLDAKAAAAPLEMLVQLIGIILLTSVFAPEQRCEISEVVEAKYTNYLCVCILRVLISLTLCFLLITCFILFMQGNGCQIMLPQYIYGTFAGSLLLGSAGMLSFGISGSMTVGYMVPALYYILNIFSGPEFFGKFYLFSMGRGSFEEKNWLLIFGVILIAVTFLYKAAVRKFR